MDELFRYLIFFSLAIAALLVLFIGSNQGKKRLETKKDELRTLYGDRTLFLCNAAEDLGKNLIQLYGEPFGGSVRPGMKIIAPNGAEYSIKEVYANDKTPDKPDLEVPAGDANSAIVIETSNWDWRSFREAKKREKILALKLR